MIRVGEMGDKVQSCDCSRDSLLLPLRATASSAESAATNETFEAGDRGRRVQGDRSRGKFDCDPHSMRDEVV
jgi:hypothetical protein